MKKLLTLAALAALVVPALPAGAVTQTGTVTVKWNTTVIATLALTTNYIASGATAAGAPTLIQNKNGGAGSCTLNGSGAAEPQGPPPTVNFGNITPDTTDVTGCLYDNAVNALVTTNSSNWSLQESQTGLPATGTGLCAFPNGFASFPATVGATAPVTVSTRTSGNAPSNGAAVTTCAAGGQAITGAATNFYTSTNAFPAGANLGEDLEALIGPTSPSGAQTVTMTYTLIAN